MKKQKCTYSVRRDELKKLREEESQLTTELQQLQIRSLSPEARALLDPHVQFKLAENMLLTSEARTQHLRVAKAQSLLTQSLGGNESHPFYARICLGDDWELRRQTLMALREQKIRAAFEYLMAPGRFENPFKPHTSDHRYENAEGDLCSIHLEAVQFPGVQSLRQVYDALQNHYNNLEISISEQFGHTTVRDDYDSIDGSVQNIRVLSRSEGCTQVESSIITFSRFVTEGDKDFGGQECGILALDCVDEDELYPYFPNERVRFDTSGSIVLTARQTDDGVMVTLRRGAFLKLHHPQFPVCEATRQGLHAGISRWGDLMIRNIRKYVYSAS